MDPNYQVSSMRLSTPTNLLFQPFSVDEIHQMSVVKIITPLSFNTLGHPLVGGLYDPAMGPFNTGTICTTCGMGMMKCVGHMGHIDLPLPVLNPLYHKAVSVVLKLSCLQCHRIIIPFSAKSLLVGQLTLLHHGCIVEAQEMSSVFAQLVFDDNFNTDDAVEIAIKDKILEHVNKVISEKKVDVAEWKGETDFRNSYIKEALLRASKGKNCPFCKVPLKKLAFVNNNILIPNTKVKVAAKFKQDQSTGDAEVSSSDFNYLMPSDIKEHLRNLYQTDFAILEALLPVICQFKVITSTPTDSLFLEVIPIPPINARPVQVLNGIMSEHPQNNTYKKILEDILVINSVLLLMKDKTDSLDDSHLEERAEIVGKLRGSTNEEKLQYALQALQRTVDSLLDTDVLKSKTQNEIGLKQIIEKKQGIIRMNMMGKRVNFAARTVITPDPNLNIDEIGVPVEFAKKLTYPVPVTYYNVKELRRMVLNGPYLHPGANFVENENGLKVKLSGEDLSQREGIAKRLLTPSDENGLKIVHRHLINGDILLMNRQPTLHKPSIMAHKARILKGERTFRMHYANCKSYNADFDGDEMNAHFPQNEVARSEGYNLVSVSKQYLVPKDGTPLSGLIQDHVVSGVRLSTRGRFFSKDEYMQLCFQGLESTGDIKCLPPCMIKPVQLWSGKQIISTIILNIVPDGLHPLNLTSKSKISSKAWPDPKTNWKAGGTPFSNPSEMSEAEVIIRGGELLCGVLDKMHYGATPYSLVHCMHELYGADSAARLLSAFSKLFTAFLQTEGFTLGVEDILVVSKADAQRKKLISQVRKVGTQVACAALDVPFSEDLRSDLAEAHRKDPSFRSLLDHHYKKSLDSFTNDINKVCLPSGLLKEFPANNLQLMVQSGAKGSTVNTMQISCLLGQIELEGKRPPLMISGRSLPSFPPYDPTPRAGGFVDGRFMTGIRPQEFFFHCMAGREGLIDTAVKTSRSGYLQRCLVKHLEGLTVRYDLTVRDSDGSVVQYLYGEDGMEVTKCQFLTEDQLPFLADNVQALLEPEVAESLKEGSDLKGLKKQKKSVKRWRKSHADSPKRRPSPFSIYSQQSACSSELNPETGRLMIADKLCHKWASMEPEEKAPFQKMCPPTPDTIVAKFQPDRHFGSVSEKMDDMISKYMKKYGSRVDAQMLDDVVHFKALSALANPGEPVGLLAAQSIGEPSTQMTLNTFHFAGRGEMNVTLGIPRLREVLMVASKNIKTPSMEVPFRKDIPKLQKQADRLRKKLTKVTLADVLEFVEVTEKLQLQPQRKQLYALNFKFLPRKAYKENTPVTPSQVLKHFEKVFMKQLLFHIKHKGKKSKMIEEEVERIESGGGLGDEEDEDNPSSVGRGLTKKRGLVGAGNDYQSSDEESENDDDDATTQRRRAKQNEEHQYSDSEEEDEPGNETNLPDGGEEDKDPKTKVDEREEGGRKNAVTSLDFVVDYRFDTEHQQWCEVTLAYPTNQPRIDFSVTLKELAGRSVISQVAGIKKAFLPTNLNGELLLKTDGKNLMEMYNHLELLDVNRLYTNDIQAVAETFGIEAASKVIVKEIQEVFKVYGITVDPRHLTLVADYMTFDGTFRPLSRIGMDGGASPLQQMSFEASLGFLRNAVLRSKKDDLLSPSARLMLGLPVACGTSAFDLLYSTNQFQIY